ncbi:C40 family peptidase [Mycoplasmatota bacterium]|nr:C40 family peptidase [Mycoplasmatota bacterium]
MLGLISSPIAKLGNKAHKSSERLDEVLYGSSVEILNEENSYFYIKSFYHYKGYVKKEDVTLIKRPINHIHEYNGILVKHFVDILDQPNVKSLPIISLPRGSYIKIIPEDIENGFQAVELINKQKGYIKKDCFRYRNILNRIQNEDILRKNLVSNAMMYLGSQYRWGGKTILGIDCSGLCHMSYLLTEMHICRDAILNNELINQYHMRRINKEDLKMGDLIYTPGHIMMYIGNEQYIHSSSITSGVTINSLQEDNSNYISKYAQNITDCVTLF